MVDSMAHGADDDPRLPSTRLTAEYWETYLEANPLNATAIGDPRFDDQLAITRPPARRRRRPLRCAARPGEGLDPLA